MLQREGGLLVIKKIFTLLLFMSVIMFTVGDEQGLAMESDGKLKKEHNEELSDEIEIRPIELLEPILDSNIKPIELLEPILDSNIRPVELLEPKLNEETKLDELKEQIRETELKLHKDRSELP